MSLGIRWHGRCDAGSPVVVLLHGGVGQVPPRVARLDPRYARMTPFAWDLRRRSSGSVVVAQIHNPAGGWARGAGLRELTDLVASLSVPRAQVVIMGHSSGGWAALRSARGCAGVVALAPWVSGRMELTHLRGVEVVVVHGDRDRITSAVASQAYVARLARAGVRTRYELVTGAGHTMLERPGRWHRLASEAAMNILTGPPR